MTDSDLLLAIELQSQFDEEFVRHTDSKKNVKRESSVLVEDNNVPPSKQSKFETLADPDWEVLDPTPDIHVLFMNFDKRFFWNTLGSVEVRWSPRMYSCAGVCSYEGRSGMCSVRLSEPLLKLRPRIDLVETLLHEMIHAYLFVTHNNRDRTGHGPEFQKHMNRINHSAGTNISIYHDFHDEVKLYQKHWWRCDGPCKNRPPFFGMVKRSMNRAPGPNDFWWTTHQASCGGKFIKVRDPKQDTSKSKETTLQKKAPDIRKFVVTSPKKPVFGSKNINKATGGTVKKLFPPSATTSGNISNRVTGFKDLNKKTPHHNVHSGSGNRDNSGTKKVSSGGKTVMNKGTGVLTVTTTKPDKSIPNKSDSFSPFTGKGHTLGTSASVGGGGHKLISSLLVRFSDNSGRPGDRDISRNDSKKTTNDDKLVSPEKYKDDFFNESQSDDELAVVDLDGGTSSGNQGEDSGNDTVCCPVCDTKINRDDMQIHLQSCDILSITLDSMNCSSILEVSDDDDDVDGSKPNGDQCSKINDELNKVPCPCCSKSVPESDVNKHLDECLSLLTIKEFEKDW